MCCCFCFLGWRRSEIRLSIIAPESAEGKRRIRIFVLSHTWRRTHLVVSARYGTSHSHRRNGTAPAEFAQNPTELKDNGKFRIDRVIYSNIFYHCLEKDSYIRLVKPPLFSRTERIVFPGYGLIVFQSPDIAQKLEFTLNWFLCKCRNDIETLACHCPAGEKKGFIEIRKKSTLQLWRPRSRLCPS